MGTIALLLCAVCANLLPKEPVKVGVYVGEGTFGLGAPRWTEIVHFAPGLEEVPLDAVAVTNGTLDGCSAVILPQGDANAMAKALGLSGCEAIRRFVANGGNCLASDGGAFLLSAGGKGLCVGIMPYGRCPSFGTGATDELHVDYIPELAKEFPIKRAPDRRLAWEGASPLMPSAACPPELESGPSFAFEPIGRFRGNLNLDRVPHQTLKGQVCDVRGTYGKGRVWASVVHSEFTPASIDVTRMQLQYVLGRPVAWQLPQRAKKQLVVAVVVDGALGVEKAKLLMRMLDDTAFDVCVVLKEEYDGFWLRHSDVSVRAGELSEATIARLHALQTAPEEPAAELKRVKQEKPLKAVLYCGPGVGDSELFNFATILDDSPKYTVECQDGDRIKDGSLEGRDFILVAGGYADRIINALKPGREQLRKFLSDGGSYYGACAGSIATLQGNGLGLVPYRWRNSPYRGHAHPFVAFTDDAQAWGLREREHRVLYWGGPEHEPGTPIEGCDVRVLARYMSETIDAFGKNNLSMKDWSAIVGGTVGKGRIVSTAVHPEEDETQFYLVYAGLRYLHGEQPKPQPVNRRRGALTVGYFMPFVVSPEMMSFALDLRRDTRFDVRPQSEHMDISGYARHLDVYVFGNGFKNGRLNVETAEYFRRGGHGIFVSADPAERAKIAGLTKGFANVSIVATHAEAKDLLRDMADAGDLRRP